MGSRGMGPMVAMKMPLAQWLVATNLGARYRLLGGTMGFVTGSIVGRVADANTIPRT